jgi:hypothetical protein
MDLLREVAPQVRIGFVGTGHPRESRAIFLLNLPVKFVLALPHTKIVGADGNSLQIIPEA